MLGTYNKLLLIQTMVLNSINTARFIYTDQATGWTVRGSNPGRGNDFYLLENFQIGPKAHPPSYSMGTEVVARG
jgi:hypothetical protein